MTTPSDSLADPLAERYGRPSRGRRVATIVAAGAVAAAFLGWLLWAMLFHADPEVASEEVGFEVLDDHLATITVRIEMDEGLTGVRCDLRAISHDKAIVGRASYVPDPDDGPLHEIEVRTDRRATTVEWQGCLADGQPRYR